MPELPEVEIAARNLRAWTLGRRVLSAGAEEKARRIFRPGRPRAFTAALAGRSVGEVRRIGKQLLIRLEGGKAPLGLLSHLGMTGKWLRRERGEAPPSHSRAQLELDDGTTLHYRDPRLFGRLRLVPGADFDAVPELAALGPDPLDDGIDAGWLASAFARRRVPVKVALLDQKLLPGVGNIQASEALFRARLDPRRRADALTRAEVKRLAEAVRASIEETIAREAGPEPHYVEEPGSENPFLVYGRAGERCPRCRREKIARAVQAQRSTFFCPRCQR
ncbi:bifunctional DNA-formamidopyrimidine glycosylase/DNA-(apurinic or apyrimidinic site) lyase [Anaeromyxobacter diazotrophicus]|uniref:Formamidopyrimidine-DNA glycosylase n=1 Tax=Anaeromyxobacter diazotrophicus TaxID=2590199 RepID=A0A7I9VTQ1_9BACT|nr:bifunctional DNA-formamidopyrimidine glycosylase/DNA-(apurinic or apyrimidinic site) lyase [Anaeromyxobacter diazotrophicus]GEJ59519.1 formamidopyrimidine-DNA glycosylase [Anaeromyxobacter diazotrophicus]